MADIADVAGEAIEVCLAAAEQQARGKSAPEFHSDFDGSHCIDCDVEIPVARLALFKVRCVDCQQALEDDVKRARG